MPKGYCCLVNVVKEVFKLLKGYITHFHPHDLLSSLEDERSLLYSNIVVTVPPFLTPMLMEQTFILLLESNTTRRYLSSVEDTVGD
jgi:hypothetical protein